MDSSMPSKITQVLGLSFVTLVVALTPHLSQAQVVAIDPATAIGPTVLRAGWDIKAWPSRLNTVSEARGLYQDVDANFLRVPFFANAHNEDGSVDASEYSIEIDAIQSVMAVRPDVEIYASLRLEGANTFPSWVSQPTANWPTQTGRIFGNTVLRPNPEHYSAMLAGFVRFMQDNGIRIDYLGLNNETEGAVPVNRYIATYDLLPAELAAAGVSNANSNFQFVGPDSFGLPSARDFVQGLSNFGRLDTIDVAASHYYPQYDSGNESDWLDLTQIAGKPIWHTEIHMPDNTDAINDLSQTLRDSLSVLFASIRNGVDSYIWWDSGDDLDEVRDVIKREVTTTTLGAHPVLTTPTYAGKGDNAGEPLFQAFVEDDEVTLWIANPGGIMNNLPIALLSGELGEIIDGRTYLAPDGDNNLLPSDIIPLVITPGESSFRILRIEPQSVAVVTFSLADEAVLLGDINLDGFVNFLDIAPFIARLTSGVYQIEADVDQSGTVGFLDITGFIVALTGG